MDKNHINAIYSRHIDKYIDLNVMFGGAYPTYAITEYPPLGSNVKKYGQNEVTKFSPP